MDLKMRPVFALFLFACIFASCAPKLLFSEEERLKLAEREVEISSVQFYNDKEIILRRKMSSSDVTVAGGVIKTIDGRQIEEVRIPRYTPCVADSFSNGHMYVRFEQGDDRQLRFYRNSYNMFQIDAEKWIAGKGLVDYGSKTFYIENAGNDALLVVKKTKAYNQATNRNFVKGVQVEK